MLQNQEFSATRQMTFAVVHTNRHTQSGMLAADLSFAVSAESISSRYPRSRLFKRAETIPMVCRFSRSISATPLFTEKSAKLFRGR